MVVETPKNPYITGGPIADLNGTGFYGRIDIFEFVNKHLNMVQRNPILLYGQRRIGKTSILRQMPNHLPSDLAVVYFDLQGKAHRTLDEVLFFLAREIQRHKAIKGKIEPVRREDITEETFAQEFLPKVFEALGGDKYKLVLLFDEMDIIDLKDIEGNTSVAAYTFREYLRTLMDEEQQTGYIFVLGRRPEELDENLNAQLFRGCVQKRIGHLSQTEMERLIVEQSKGYLQFAPESLEAIYALTDGHPFCAQLICQQIWSRSFSIEVEHPVPVSSENVFEAIPEALTYGKMGLNWIYDGLIETAHRLFLSATAEVVDKDGKAHISGILGKMRQHRISLAQPEFQIARRDLVTWGVLESVGPDTYRFKVELIRRWIAADRSLEQMKHEVRFISRRAYRFYEIADEDRQAGQLDEAIDNYEKALEVFPQLIEARQGLADVLRQKEQWAEAIEAYERLRELDPNQIDGLQEVLLEYGTRLEETGETGEAINQYDRAAKITDNPRIKARLERSVLNHSRILMGSNRFDEARLLLERFGYTGDIEELESLRARALQRIEARVSELTAPSDQPDWEEALKIINEYHQLNPSDERAPRLRDETSQRERDWNTAQGDALMGAGKYQEAATFYQKADYRIKTDLALKKARQAEEREAILARQEQINEPEWEKFVQAVASYVKTYPDDEEMNLFEKEAKEKLASSAGLLLKEKQFESAIEKFEYLDDRRSLADALSLRGQDNISKSLEFYFRGAFFSSVIGGIGLFFAENNFSNKILYTITTAGGIISVLTAVYFILQLIISNMIMSTWFIRSLRAQLSADLSIAEMKRRVHNAEYIHPIPGIAFGLSIVFGIANLITLVNLPLVIGGQSAAHYSELLLRLLIPRVSEGASLATSILSFVIPFLAGIGASIAGFRPPPLSPRKKELSSADDFFFPFIVLGVWFAVIFGVILSLSYWVPDWVSFARGVILIILGLMALGLLLVAWEAISAIRRIIREEVET